MRNAQTRLMNRLMGRGLAQGKCVLVKAGEWAEDLHPRDRGGEFAPKAEVGIPKMPVTAADHKANNMHSALKRGSFDDYYLHARAHSVIEAKHAPELGEALTSHIEATPDLGRKAERAYLSTMYGGHLRTLALTPPAARQAHVERLTEEMKKVLATGDSGTHRHARTVLNKLALLNENPPSAEDLGTILRTGWKQSSRNFESQVLQQAVKDELGSKSPLFFSNWDKDAEPMAMKAVPPKTMKAVRQYVRGVYERTQAWFQEKGVKSVNLYRGVDSEVVADSPLSSWTTRPEIAEDFDGHDILNHEVDVKSIYVAEGAPDWEGKKPEAEHIVIS